MMKFFIAVIFFAVAFTMAGSAPPAPFEPPCHHSVQELGRHAGFYPLAHSRAARMFHYFFESRGNKKDPVVLWLTGGPGCGSEIALLLENGPFKLTNNSLVPNRYSWNMASNLLYVDQPTGTGFSYSPDKYDIRVTEESIASDLYDLLQAFFRDRREYVHNDFYITGESYAGHYIPVLASRIHKGNKERNGIPINMKGFAIGNGWTNPPVQYKAYADYALKMKLIAVADYESIKNTLLPICQHSIKNCTLLGGEACKSSHDTCDDILDRIMMISGVNEHDIRQKYGGDFKLLADVQKFLNQRCVQEALGVGEVQYFPCNDNIQTDLATQFVRNLAVGIPALLEDGIQVLIYAGEYDLICNWIGNARWVREMKWAGAKQFRDSRKRAFMVDGVKAGELKSYGPLAFLKVFDAGHMVPMNQPKASLEMLTRWINGKITKPING